MTRRTAFVVVRHGETEWNVAQRVQGQQDSRLTPAGERQADAIAARLAGERFERLVSSDLGRAMDTARRIAARCGLPIEPDARLRERNFGVAEGLSYEEVDRRWPGVFSRSQATDPELAVPEGETRRQFHERIHHAFEDLARRHEGERLLVVAHGGVLAALYRMIQRIPVGAAHKVPISNASYNAVIFRADAWEIEAWDDVSHLPGAAPFVES